MVPREKSNFDRLLKDISDGRVLYWIINHKGVTQQQVFEHFLPMEQARLAVLCDRWLVNGQLKAVDDLDQLKPFSYGDDPAVVTGTSL